MQKLEAHLFGTDSEGDTIMKQIILKSSNKSTPKLSRKKIKGMN